MASCGLILWVKLRHNVNTKKVFPIIPAIGVNLDWIISAEFNLYSAGGDHYSWGLLWLGWKLQGYDIIPEENKNGGKKDYKQQAVAELWHDSAMRLDKTY